MDIDFKEWLKHNNWYLDHDAESSWWRLVGNTVVVRTESELWEEFQRADSSVVRASTS